MKAVGAYMRAFTTALRSLSLGSSLSSFRLVFRPVELYHYSNASLFLRDTLSGLRGLPQRYPWEIYSELQDVSWTLPSVVDAWHWNDPSFAADLMTLGILCRAISPRLVFEIGTFKGYTSLLFAANSNPDTKILTLDLPAGSNGTRGELTLKDQMLAREGKTEMPCFSRHPLGVKVISLKGDSAVFDFTPYHQSIDLFFIDGAHTYDYVREDTMRAIDCARPGGAIAWHDYGRSGLSRGVTRWLNELGKYCKVYSSPGSSVAFMSCTEQNLSDAAEMRKRQAAHKRSKPESR